MSNQEITVLAALTAKPTMNEKVKEKALSLVEPTRAEQGCISYDFYESAEDPQSFVFFETWTSKDALDEHISKPHLQSFISQIKDLLAEPLNVSIWKKLT